MFENIKKFFKKEEPKPEPKARPKKLSAKEQATKNNEPYVSIVKVNVDPENVGNGAFELDWNDKFLLNLIKAGYKVKADDTDNVIVDRWFQSVCRNIALELYEQDQADPANRDPITGAEMRVVKSKDIGNGYSEVS
jgi:hypothetical protein